MQMSNTILFVSVIGLHLQVWTHPATNNLAEISEDCLLVSTYVEHPPVVVRFGRRPQTEFLIPCSTQSERTNVALFEEDSVTTSTGEWTFRRDRAESQVVYTSISSNQQGAIRENNSTAEDMETSTLPYGSQLSAPIISPSGMAESLHPAIPDAVNTVHIIESDNQFRKENTIEPSEVMEEQTEAGLEFAQQYLKDGAEIVPDKEIELATASSQTPAWKHINTNAEAMAAAEQLSDEVACEVSRKVGASVAQEQPEVHAMQEEEPLFPRTETWVMANSPSQPLNEQTADDTESATASECSDGRPEGTEYLADDSPVNHASLHQQHSTEMPKPTEKQSAVPSTGVEAAQRISADSHTDAEILPNQGHEHVTAASQIVLQTPMKLRSQRAKRKRAPANDDGEAAHEENVVSSTVQRQSMLTSSNKKPKTRADYSRKRRGTDRGLFIMPDPPTAIAPSPEPETPSPPQRVPTSSTATAVSQDEKSTRRLRRSCRSTPVRHKADTPIIFCSSAVESVKDPKVRTTFDQLGGTLATGVADAMVYCIADKPLVKTSGLILALALGKEIVTERWLVEMSKIGGFPDPKDYLPNDRTHEAEWNFNLEEAIKRGKDGLNAMLSAYDIQCTPRLKLELTEKKHYKDFAQIARALGAKFIRAGWPPATCASENLIVLGAKQDPHAAAVGKSGHQLYDKDLIAMAALRGKLELDSAEFLLTVVKKESGD